MRCDPLAELLKVAAGGEEALFKRSSIRWVLAASAAPTEASAGTVGDDATKNTPGVFELWA